MARLKSHAIFCDTSLNPERVVYRNIYQSHLLAAMKMYRYIRGWGISLSKKGVTKFLSSKCIMFESNTVEHSHFTDVIHKMVRFTYTALRSKTAGRIGRAHGATCTINELTVIWWVNTAFVFGWRPKLTERQARRSCVLDGAEAQGKPRTVTSDDDVGI
jgi:hypothetical protein